MTETTFKLIILIPFLILLICITVLLGYYSISEIRYHTNLHNISKQINKDRINRLRNSIAQLLHYYGYSEDSIVIQIPEGTIDFGMKTYYNKITKVFIAGIKDNVLIRERQTIDNIYVVLSEVLALVWVQHKFPCNKPPKHWDLLKQNLATKHGVKGVAFIQDYHGEITYSYIKNNELFMGTTRLCFNIDELTIYLT